MLAFAVFKLPQGNLVAVNCIRIKRNSAYANTTGALQGERARQTAHSPFPLN